MDCQAFKCLLVTPVIEHRYKANHERPACWYRTMDARGGRDIYRSRIELSDTSDAAPVSGTTPDQQLFTRDRTRLPFRVPLMAIALTHRPA